MTAGVKRIERANAILAVAFTALAGVVWGPRGTLGAAAGALIACADFHVLARLGARAVVAARDGASAGALGGLAFALLGKMTALFALVFLALRVAHLPAAAFGLGFSVLVISILLVSLSGRSVEAGAPTP
ncbi:MAG TPA: ATP synthase subunit I [Polyangia bacterium]|nr:ATP synthase subunit I [Polyangia bacterium]